MIKSVQAELTVHMQVWAPFLSFSLFIFSLNERMYLPYDAIMQMVFDWEVLY